MVTSMPLVQLKMKCDCNERQFCFIPRLDTERSEVSNFLRYRHRGHLTDLDLPQLC